MKGLAITVVALLASLLLAANCQVPQFGTPGTGGAPATGGAVADAGTPETGGSATGGSPSCEYVPSSRLASRSLRPRIVGGEPSSEGAYPWTVALETATGWQYCGGSVIAPRWVLTAAHCQAQVGDFAHIGTLDLREPGRRVGVAEVRNHPSWTDTTSGHDVAVLRLDSGAGVPAVRLAGDVVDAASAITIGWGATCEGCSTTPTQQHVSVPLVARELCQLAYAGKIDETMLCAGAGGSGSCQGDSGGPLVVQAGDGLAQLGITSWGRGCARPGVPGVYTSVPSVLAWIEDCAR